MKRIPAKIRVSEDGKVAVQLPQGVAAGEYHAVLMWVYNVGDEETQVLPSATDVAEGQHSDQTMPDTWDWWVAEVAQMPQLQPLKQEYHQLLIEKYRKQGLIL